MKKLYILFLLLFGLYFNSFGQVLKGSGLNVTTSIQLGDSIVNVIGQDTLINPEMARNIAKLVKVDSSTISDTALYAIVSAAGDSVFVTITGDTVFYTNSIRFTGQSGTTIDSGSVITDKLIVDTSIIAYQKTGNTIIDSSSITVDTVKPIIIQFGDGLGNDTKLDSTSIDVDTLFAEYIDINNLTNNGILFNVGGLLQTSSDITWNGTSLNMNAGRNISFKSAEIISSPSTGEIQIDADSVTFTNELRGRLAQFDTTKTPVIRAENFYLDLGTTSKAGAFDKGTTNPTNTTRYNFNATLVPTNIWSVASSVSLGNGVIQGTYSGSSGTYSGLRGTANNGGVGVSAETQTNGGLALRTISVATDAINSAFIQDVDTILRIDSSGITIKRGTFIDSTNVNADTIKANNGFSIGDGDVITTSDTLNAKTFIESTPIDSMKFNPINDESSNEGSLHYDARSRSLIFHNDIPGFHHNLGYEHVIRFHNNTGGTLTNGTIIRSSGAKVNGAITFKALLAGNASLDSLQGVAMVTADCPADSFGVAVVIGQANFLNTSMYSDNQLLYQGHAGTYDTIRPAPPLFAKIVGRVIYADADSGAIYFYGLSETKYAPNPDLSMYFTRQTQTITNPGQNTPTLITNVTNNLYTVDLNYGFTETGDSINARQEGVYLFTSNFAFQGDAATGDDWRVGIFKNGVEQFSVLRTSSSTNKGVVSCSKILELSTTDWVTFKVINTTNGTRSSVFTDGVINVEYISSQ